MALNLTPFRRFILLNKLIQYIENTLVKELKAKRQKLGDKLHNDLIDNGLDKIPLGNKTVYIHESMIAKVSSKEAAMETLKKTGYGAFIKEKYESRSLPTLLNQIMEAELERREEMGEPTQNLSDVDLLPKEFKDVIWTDYVYNMRVSTNPKPKKKKRTPKPPVKKTA